MVDSKYMVPFGVLKLAEFICLLISWATVVNQYNAADNKWVFNNMTSKPAFHVTVCIIAWIFSLFWFILNVAGACAKMKIGSKHIINAVIHLILGILVLIAASLVADVFSAHSGYHTFKAGAAFGIISALLLIADAVLHLLKGNEGGEAI